MRLLAIAIVVMTSSCVHDAVSNTSPDRAGLCTFEDRCVSGPGEYDGVVSVVVTSAVVATVIAYTVYQQMSE
jgi:hypothetical protein